MRDKNYYKFPSVWSRVYWEIELFLGSIIVFISLKAKINANFISVFPVIQVLVLIIALLNINNALYANVILLYLNIIHSWDWADGEIARRTNSSSKVGHFIDEASSTTINDLIFIYLTLLIFGFYSNYIFILIIGVYIRTSRLKNYFYRLYHTSLKMESSIDNNSVRTIDKVPINAHYSIIFSSHPISFLVKLVHFLNHNDFRIITLFAVFFRDNLNFMISLYAVYFVINAIKFIWDLVWIIKPNLIQKII